MFQNALYLHLFIYSLFFYPFFSTLASSSPPSFPISFSYSRTVSFASVSRTLRCHKPNETANSKRINECYNRIPKSAVLSELNKQSVTQWQNKWDRTTKGATTKSFFPKIPDRLKMRISVTPNFTTLITGHGNIKTYLYKYKIIDTPCALAKAETRQWITYYSIARNLRTNVTD